MELDERRAKVREMVKNGKTRKVIAEELGVSMGTVNNDLKKTEAKSSKPVAKRIKDKATEAASAVKTAVRPRRFPPERAERREAQGELVKDMLLGRPSPRAARIHMYDGITGKKAVDGLRVAMVDAEIEIADGPKLDAIVADYMERAEVQHGSHG